ncbi:MAG TPA: hypothetical protein VIH90_04925 [Candidatus Saccharimonadales bacterium]
MTAATIIGTELGLPVFGPDTEVLTTKEEFRAAQNGVNDRFIRIVGLLGGNLTDLTEVIEAADQAMTRFATIIGAKVVDHEWGFYKPTNIEGFLVKRRQCKSLLPPGLALVATVDVVRNVEEINYNSPHFRPIDQGVDHFYTTESGLIWDEAGVEQCVIGTTTKTPEPGRIVVDIDPVLISEE